jgi:hypothetical protein
MASQNLRLDLLHAQGDITVTNSDALNVSHNTIADVFDSDITTNSMIVLNNDEDPAHTLITINDNQPHPKLANRIVLTVGVVLTGRVLINEGLQDQLIVNWDTGRTSYNTFRKTLTINFPREISKVSTIKILYDTFDESYNPGSNNDVRLYGVQLFGKLLYPFEFNDSVLSTKAWNSSRYDGKQLSATTINEFNTGDISYGGAPVMQKYTRNIYIGNSIFGGDTSGEKSEFLDIPGHSYITSTKRITVNSDDSVTEQVIENFKGTNLNPIKGYSRAFVEDFKLHSNAQVILLDDTISQNLKTSYKVFSNLGLFKKVIGVKPASPFALGIGHSGGGAAQTSSYFIGAKSNKVIIGSTPPEGEPIPAGASSGDPENRFNSGMTIEVFSSQELNNFYTGSFFGDAYTFGQVEEDALGFINQGASNYVSLKRMAEFIRDLLNHSNKGAGAAEDSLSFQLKDNRRFFVTFCESGTPPESSSFTPIILGRQGTLSGSLATNTYAARAAGGDFDLSDFSTVEIVGGQTNVMPSQGINQPHLTFGGPGDESYGQDGYGVPVLNIKDIYL